MTADTRPRVRLTKPVVLAQLAAEVGAALSASDTEVVVADPNAPVTAETLQAAVEAHTPDLLWAPTVEGRNALTVEQRLDAALGQLRTFIDGTKPTTAAAQASQAYDAAKLCARVCVGLVRLHLRRLESAD